MKFLFTDACLSLFLLLLTTTGASKSTSSASFTSPTADHSFDNDAAKDTADNLARQLLGRELDRQLEAGDFDSFNELFENAKIVIDDEFQVQEKAGLWTLVLWLSNIRCFEISVEDIVVEHSQPSNTQVDVSIDIVELDLTCDVDYRYDYGPFRGSGWVRVFTDNNKASTDLRFVSPSFDTHPPLSSSVTDCVTDIEITNMDFNGGIVANLVDLFERLIRNPIEGAIEGVACDELGSLGTSFVTDMLDVADEVLFQYEGDLGDEINDPLYLELTTQLPETIQPLNLQDTDSLLGGWVSKALEAADNLLGSRVPDPENDSRDDDLGVNILLRTHLLDENRALVVDVAQLMDNNVLFEGHDKLTETSIALNSIKVLGLDTLTRFNPMIAISQRTLQNELTWEYLTLEFDVTVSVKPSSKTDAILQDATSEGITERIAIDFTITDVDIVASLFLVIDQEALGSMEIGPILHIDNLLPCLLSIIPIVELSGLEVSPTLNVNTPTLNGFSSPGLDRLLSNSIQAAFDMYKGVLTTRLPNIFQTSVRNLINRDIIGEYLQQQDDESSCPSVANVVGENTLVDFRDLLLPPDEAALQGGSGTAPYGDLAYTAMELLKDNLLSTDEDTGLLDLNSFLISPVTKSQSGVEGMLRLNEQLVSLTKTSFANGYIRSFVDKFQIGLYDLRIQNLDTLKPPASILETATTTLPSDSVLASPQNLINRLTFGWVDDRPLNMTVRFMLNLEGEDEEGSESPLSMQADVDVGLSIGLAGVYSNIFMAMDATRFLQFPLQDMLNFDCWLATLQNDDDDIGLKVVDFIITLFGLSLDTSLNFRSIVDPGVATINDLLSVVQSTGAGSMILERVGAFGEEIVKGDWLDTRLGEWIDHAPKFCPHSPEYDEKATPAIYDEIDNLPGLSELTIDSLMFMASLVGEVSIITFLENQRLKDVDPTHPLSLEMALDIPESVLDWTNLGGNVGSFVDGALEEARRYLGGMVTDSSTGNEDLGINLILRDWLFKDKDDFIIEFDEVDFELPGVAIAFNSLKVEGLDSITKFEMWEPIGSQTVQNSLALEFLKLTLQVDVIDTTTTTKRQEITFSLSFHDIEATVPLFAALDQDKLGLLELGSFLDTNNILSCLLSAMHDIEITQIDASVGRIDEPEVTGLMVDTDTSIRGFTAAVWSIYHDKMIESMPKIFDSTVRGLLNGLLHAYTEENPCPSGQGTVSDSQFVDFRDFFESNDYGNLPPLLKNLLDDELLATDPETGKPRINEILIAPYTKAQSGVEGSLKFANELFAFSSKAIPQFGLDSIQLQVFDVAIENLDTLGAPLELLQPNSTNGFVLDNYVTFDGNATESLRFSLKGLFALNGGPELEIRNEMELSLAIEEPELFASILAKVDSEALASFPLGNIVDGNCLLALLATPLMGESGYIVSSAAKGLSLETLLLSYPSFQFDLSCSNCTNSGSDVIPALLEGLEDIGVSESLEQRLFGLGLDLVRSDFFQAYLNRLVVDGSLRCPHSPYFEGESASSNYPIPNLPSLSYESLESVAFASTILMQVAIVVIAESHASYDAGENDPLSGQALLDASSAYNFVDFMSLESSIGEWADVAVDQLLDYLSATIEDPKGEDGKDLRINSLIRSTLLDEAGLLEIMFDDLNFGGDNMEVSLEDIRVVGLDTISSFDILDAIGSQTLRNRVKWDNVGIEMIVSLMVTEDSSRRLNTQEDITIYLELSEIDVSLALLLAMDLDLLGSLELSSMLEVKNILPCLLTAAREAELTELQVVIGSISEFSINGFRSSELQDFSTKSTRFIMDSFGDIILSSMPGFFDRTVRALLNNWIDFYMGDSSNVACDSVSFEGTTSSFVDFRDLFLSAATSRLFGGSGLSPYGDLFKTALGFVQDLVLKIDASTGLSKINDILIAPLTRSQSESAGTLVVPGDLFNSGSRVQVGGLDATVQLRASDARVDNLDTIVSPLAVLEAVDGEAHELNNTVTFGVTDRPLRFAVRFLFSLIGDDMQIRNDLDISLDLSNANVVLQAMLKVAESSFYTFPLRDTLDYNCWLAMMPAPELDSSGIRVEGSEATARLTELAASISYLNLNISCVECSGPRMIELTELLSSTEGQEAATEIANTLLGYVAELLGGNFLEIKIDRLLKDAARKCPHSPTYEADAEEIEYEPFEEPNSEGSISFLILIGGVTVGLILCLCVLLSSIRCFVRRRHKKWLSGLSARQLQRLVSQQDKEQEVESELNASTQSMFTSQDIPIFVRWSMPLIILANIGFFLSGHLSLGATVHIELQLAGEKFGVDQFFEFSMAKSTIDIWNAGGRELAIMILIFSVIWPYTKQLITLVLWFLPPTKLSVSRRGSILLWLDCLGKWSMIDIFVLVITLVAFRVSIVSPSIGFLPENFYSINLLVVPLWGLYANMIAQLVSQVSSHFIIHYHRNIIHEARKAPQGESLTNAGKSTLTVEQACDISTSSDRREVVHHHSFGRPHRGETDKLVIRRWVNKSLWLVTACLVALVAVGSTLPAFSIDILGLIGVAVESGQRFEDASTQYSVFTVVQLLMEEAQFLDTLSDYIGLGSLSLLLVFSVLLVPIVQGVTLLYQWSKPTTSRGKARIAIFIEILQAWQYAEVYLIAIFVASWQLGPVSQFMVNSYCDSLKDTFAQLVYYGILKEEDAQCFSVQSSIEDGSFILAAGAVLLALLNTVVNKAIVQYFRDNNNRKGMLNDDEEKVIESEIVNQSIDRIIHPVPVLFSDTFRWLLVRSSDFVSSSRALFAPLEEHSEMHKGGESIIQRGVEVENEALKDNPANGDNLSRSTEKPDSSSSMHVSD